MRLKTSRMFVEKRLQRDAISRQHSQVLSWELLEQVCQEVHQHAPEGFFASPSFVVGA